jgi:predicted nucleotidyltransferase
VTDKLENKTGIQNVTFMRAWATHLAGWLHRNGQGVQSIELFGSLARGEGGMDSDFDLIIAVDGFTSARWFYDVRDELMQDPFYGEGTALVRRQRAFKALKIDESGLEDGTGVKPDKLDIFLLPPNWRERLSELQELGSHSDPNFMQNIARDARTFVSEQGFPFPVIVP